MPFHQFFTGIRVVETLHRAGETMSWKATGRLSSNALGWRIRSDQFRMFLLEALQVAHHLIKLEVRDGGLAQDVVVVFVLANTRAEILDLRLDRAHSDIVF